MKQKLTYHLLVMLLISASSCRSKNAEQEVAQEFCRCFQQMTELYQQVQSQNESAPNDRLIDLMKELESAAAASEDCVEQVEMDYGDLLDEKEEEIKAEMQKRCPKVVETMEEIDRGYE